jgi:outer membrane protein assembly factor BamB
VVAGVLLAGLVGSLALKCPEEIPVAPRSVDDTFGRLRTVWVKEEIGSVSSWSRPVVVGDVVVFATGDQRLVARDLATGTRKWSTRVTAVDGNVGEISGRNLVASNGVVVAAVANNTVGVEVATGRELWSYNAPPDTMLDPSEPGNVAGVELDADEATVYIPAWGPSISAVEVRTGQARWIWGAPPGTPYRAGGKGVRISGDTLYATVWHNLNERGTRTEGWVLALDRRDGRELKRVVIPPYTFGTVFRGRPVVWRHLVIVTGEPGLVWAFDRFSFELVWQYQPSEAKSGTVGGAELYGDVLYLDSGGAYLVALRAADGSLIWRTPVVTQATAGLHVTATRIYWPETDLLDVFDRATGRYLVRTKDPLWTYARGGMMSTAATSSGKQVFINILHGAWSFWEP